MHIPAAAVRWVLGFCPVHMTCSNVGQSMLYTFGCATAQALTRCTAFCCESAVACTDLQHVCMSIASLLLVGKK